MLRYYGVTELTGRPGSGRTAICMDESRRYRSVYITTTTLCTRRYGGAAADEMDRIFVKYVPSVLDLATFVVNELEVFVVGKDIELVIIDSLDHLLATEDWGRSHGLVFRIVNRLKRMNQKHSVRILVVTCYYGGWRVGSFCICNPVLGLGWMYMVNTRYVCSGDQGSRTLRLVYSPVDDEEEWMFRIGASDVVYSGPVSKMDVVGQKMESPKSESNRQPPDIS